MKYPYLLPALIGLLAITALYMALAPYLATNTTVLDVLIR